MSHMTQSKLVSTEICKSREERIKHIDLSSPCEFGYWNSKSFFLHFLDIENDVENWQIAGIARCHLCSNDTTSNQICINPKHVYLGSYSENCFDKPDETRRLPKSKQWTVDMKKRLCQPVIATNIKTNEVLYFESAKEAAEQLNCNQGCISEVIKGNRKQHKGFRFAKA